MTTVRILGVSGSPRRGNTDYAVKAALKAAEELPGVETEFYGFAGKRWNPCVGCYDCSSDKASEENPCPHYPYDEAMKLTKKMEECDGIIIGCPVYIGTVPAQLKAFFDRSVMVTEDGRLGPMGLRNKAVGAVVTAWDRQGGHEMTIVDIWRWACLNDMIFVGVGPERNDCNNYWGACLLQSGTSTHPDGGKGVWFEETNTPEELTAVKYDEVGILNACRLGKRVAEMAKVIKAGYDSLPDGETYWPAGKCGGYVYD